MNKESTNKIIEEFKTSISDIITQREKATEMMHKNLELSKQMYELASKIIDEERPFDGVVFNRFSPDAYYSSRLGFVVSVSEVDPEKWKLIETIIEEMNRLEHKKTNEEDDAVTIKRLCIGLRKDPNDKTTVSTYSDFSNLVIFTNCESPELVLKFEPYSLTDLNCLGYFRNLKDLSDRYGFKIDPIGILNSLLEAMAYLKLHLSREERKSTFAEMERRMKVLPTLLSFLMLSGVCVELTLPDDEDIKTFIEEVKKE